MGFHPHPTPLINQPPPDDAVALHLPEPQPAVARAPLHRLPRQDLRRAAPPGVDLEVDHVLEALVVGGV